MDAIQGGMMSEREYKEIHEFTKEDLQDLFLSAEWSSGHFPERLPMTELWNGVF